MAEETSGVSKAIEDDFEVKPRKQDIAVSLQMYIWENHTVALKIICNLQTG